MKKLLFLTVLISGVAITQPLDEKQYILQSQKGAVFDLITFIVEDGNFRIDAIKTNQPNLKYRQSNYNASETSFLLVFKVPGLFTRSWRLVGLISSRFHVNPTAWD